MVILALGVSMDPHNKGMQTERERPYGVSDSPAAQIPATSSSSWPGILCAPSMAMEGAEYWQLGAVAKDCARLDETGGGLSLLPGNRRRSPGRAVSPEHGDEVAPWVDN